MVRGPGSGWYFESQRHSLAARGIPTSPKNISQGSTDRPRIEEFIEGHMFLTHPSWVCVLEEDNIHLGLYIEMIDATEHGFDPEDYDEEYPILLNSMVMVVPEESHPEFMDDVQESIGDDYIEPTAFDVAQYMGGVQASHAIEGVSSAAKSDVPSRIITERNGRESRWFRNREEAEEYVKDVYIHNAHPVFTLIGFLLDQPINMAGNNGWDVIRQQKNNEEYIGKWRR